MQSIPVYLLAALASMCLFGCSGRPAAPEDISPPPAISDVKEGTAVTADTKIADVMTDPVFGGYGRLLFPVQSSYYSGETLGELHLTWYACINFGEAICPQEIETQTICIDKDIGQTLQALLK